MPAEFLANPATANLELLNWLPAMHDENPLSKRHEVTQLNEIRHSKEVLDDADHLNPVPAFCSTHLASWTRSQDVGSAAQVRMHSGSSGAWCKRDHPRRTSACFCEQCEETIIRLLILTT